jgi:hypothetical protein
VASKQVSKTNDGAPPFGHTTTCFQLRRMVSFAPAVRPSQTFSASERLGEYQQYRHYAFDEEACDVFLCS